MPLDSWTADMGGRGVTILAAFQSRAQLIARWGTTGAAIILNNTAAVMVFGGTKDRDDLDYWSTLAGDRDEPVASFDDHGRRISRTVRKVPVLAAAQLANLPSRAGRGVSPRDGAGDRPGAPGVATPRRPRAPSQRPSADPGAAGRRRGRHPQHPPRSRASQPPPTQHRVTRALSHPPRRRRPGARRCG
ncbi:MAG: TraM recognition domain-containing protein [Thermoleophilaceae bacterium]